MKHLGDYTFQFKTTGTLLFDPGQGTKNFDSWWCIVKMEEEIASYYSWLLKRWGLETDPPNKLWGFHLSCIKGEEPLVNKEQWASNNSQNVEIYYGSWVNYSNGRHAWVDCYSDELSDIRRSYGLDVNGGKVKYHATIGRLKIPWQPDIKRPGTVYRDGTDIVSI